MGVRARFDSKCGRSVGVGGYPAAAAWFRSWAQKIAELNLRFCEQQQGPLKSLNQSRGGMCICRKSGTGLGVSQEGFGP